MKLNLLQAIFIGGLLLSLVSCQSKEEKLFTEYAKDKFMKSDNIDIEDLDFKIISIEKIKDITVKDSLNYLIPIFKKRKTSRLNNLNRDLEYKIQKVKRWKDEVENPPKKQKIIVFRLSDNYAKKKYEEALKEEEEIKEKIKVYENNCEGTPLEKDYNKIEEYKSLDDNHILSTEYNVKFSVKNPIMNVKQTFDRIAYTDTEGKFTYDTKK